MTAQELARKLLEGPDVLVVKSSHEPNDDTFDEILRLEGTQAWQVDYEGGAGWNENLYQDPPRHPETKRRSVDVVVLR